MCWNNGFATDLIELMFLGLVGEVTIVYKMFLFFEQAGRVFFPSEIKLEVDYFYRVLVAVKGRLVLPFTI